MASVPLEAVANFIAEHAKAEHAKTTAAAVEDAMYEGKLPPNLRAWGLDLCDRDPVSFRKFIANSPFDISGSLTVGKQPPVSGAHAASAPDEEHKAAICRQLNLSDGALDG